MPGHAAISLFAWMCYSVCIHHTSTVLMCCPQNQHPLKVSILWAAHQQFNHNCLVIDAPEFTYGEMRLKHRSRQKSRIPLDRGSRIAARGKWASPQQWRRRMRTESSNVLITSWLPHCMSGWVGRVLMFRGYLSACRIILCRLGLIRITLIHTDKKVDYVVLITSH